MLFAYKHHLTFEHSLIDLLESRIDGLTQLVNWDLMKREQLRNNFQVLIPG